MVYDLQNRAEIAHVQSPYLPNTFIIVNIMRLQRESAIASLQNEFDTYHSSGMACSSMGGKSR